MKKTSFDTLCLVTLLLLGAVSQAGAQSFVRRGDSRLTDPVNARPPLWTHGGMRGTARPSASSGISGHSPAQLRRAYGFDQITGDGSGQTIAIVDAYGSPTLQQDVAAFCAAFGLPAANITVAYPQGAPAANSGWALETSLDVEWAHAIAPGAKILVVIARTASLSNLLGAVDYAVSQGASQVSMSWGSNEFPGQTGFDYHFNVPGVSFFAASGDSGAGTSWPAASPYVISVGGTTLHLDAVGNVLSETGWSGSGGGVSIYETRPGFQNGWQSSANRSIPDVSYAADPATGFPVYISNYGGTSGWITVGGTSAGAPQWAALSALVNSSRSKALSAPAEALYYLAATSFTPDFRDITAGSNGGFLATVAYDLVTGLGSPAASTLIPSLSTYSTTALPPPVLAVSQGATSLANGASVDFGTATQGAAVVTQDFVLANVGNSDLVVSVSLQTSAGTSAVIASAPGFTIVTSPTARIPAGGSTTVRVGMKTNVAGTAAANLLVGSNDSTQNPFSVALTGVVTGSTAQISASSGSTAISSGGTLAFGDTVVGVPASQTLTISNAGKSDLKLTGWLIAPANAVSSLPAVTGFNAKDFAALCGIFSPYAASTAQALDFRIAGPFPLPTSIAAGKSANVQLSLNAFTLGDKAAQLLIYNNVTPGVPYRVNLTGHINPNPNSGRISVAFSAGTVASGGVASYGVTTVGVPVANTFTVTNTGSGQLQFNVSLSNQTATKTGGKWTYRPPAFKIVSVQSMTLAPGQSSVVQVQFNPAVSATSFISAIAFTSPNPSAGSYNAVLTGTSQ
ncbi:choice-of-anchor D domain-containing protein [Prosthecobacter sp.]|uniref:choice-of-anchor D domain-containing protein n=1 Tax=Prosthecobacter sp. TaxID=1965333 RepID=UPI003782D2B9